MDEAAYHGAGLQRAMAQLGRLSTMAKANGVERMQARNRGIFAEPEIEYGVVVYCLDSYAAT